MLVIRRHGHSRPPLFADFAGSPEPVQTCVCVGSTHSITAEKLRIDPGYDIFSHMHLVGEIEVNVGLRRLTVVGIR
jgi:hypothetical protein